MVHQQGRFFPCNESRGSATTDAWIDVRTKKSDVEAQGGVTNLAQDLRIPKDDDAILCPRKSNVQPPGVVQETDSLMLVAPNAAQDDVVFLSSLKRVDACHFDVLVQVLP